MKWFGKSEKRTDKDAPQNEWTMLERAVDIARRDWQNAHHRVNLSESEEEVDGAIYYLRLTEKRYMFLLDRARQYRRPGV